MTKQSTTAKASRTYKKRDDVEKSKGAKLLRQRRESADMKQGEAAAKIGVGQSTLSNVENGHKTPSIALAAAIKKHFGVPFEAWL